MNKSMEEEALQTLTQQKQDLLQELKNIEENLKQTEKGEDEQGPVPLSTHALVRLETSDTAVLLVVTTNTQAPIRSVVLFGESIFQEESFIVYVRCEKVFYDHVVYKSLIVEQAPQTTLFRSIHSSEISKKCVHGTKYQDSCWTKECHHVQCVGSSTKITQICLLCEKLLSQD